VSTSTNLEQKTFIAAVLHGSRRYRLYSLYLVNNTQETIDSIIVIAPGWLKAATEDTALSATEPSLVDNIGVRRYEEVPPKSYVELTTCFDWDFDWSNNRYVILKTRGREEHLRFNIDRDVVAGTECPGIPVLGRAGYACLGEPVPARKATRLKHSASHTHRAFPLPGVPSSIALDTHL
jgi:hypothetical protein